MKIGKLRGVCKILIATHKHTRYCEYSLSSNGRAHAWREDAGSNPAVSDVFLFKNTKQHNCEIAHFFGFCFPRIKKKKKNTFQKTN